MVLQLANKEWENVTVFRTKIKRVHFVGIGGIGMSGIAEVLLTLGFEVSGSDQKESITTARLKKLGARVFIGHKAEQVEPVDVVVVTSAVKADNPEVQRAHELEIPVIPRAEMLAELMRLKDGIAVAGSHGKTTSTSLLAWVLSEAGLDPTFVVGGRLASFGTNARLGESRLLVAEADESDGSFLSLTPSMNIVTNIEPEHMDYYGSVEKLHDAFVAFANRVPFYGVNVVCLDHVGIQAVLPRIIRRCVTFGVDTDAEFRAVDVEPAGSGMAFTVVRQGKTLGRFTTPLPGKHNVLNALGVFAAAMQLEVPLESIRDGLARFAGVDRRFQVRGHINGVTVVDDYGHHPTEIRVTLEAARTLFKGKVVAVFQPHRFTRVRDFFNQFASSFGKADVVIVTDIYRASETPIDGITPENIVRAIRNNGHEQVICVPNREDVASVVRPMLERGDVLITLGAGDVNKCCVEVLDLLENEGEA